MLKRILILSLLSVSLQFAGESSQILESRETFTIKSIDEAEHKVFRKIYIADKTGKDFAKLSLHTNDYIDLESVSVKLFDKKGKRKKKYKKKHFEERKFSGSGIIGDEDFSFVLNVSTVLPTPFTLELEYTKTYHSLFFWPTWSPQRSIDVVHASYTVDAPAEYTFRSFSPAGLEGKKISETQTVWEQSDIAPWADDSSVPAETYDRHRVFFAPQAFELDDYSGSSESWEAVSDFYASLARDQYTLDPLSVNDLNLSDASTLRDSIAEIYDYVQRKTRYVGMELGVHGWKPHSSQWVCDNKYGDCKDLATFFISILRLNGIKAYPVLIRTRDRGVTYPEFPDYSFNHAIACVPLATDTLWVDCTADDGRIDIIPEGNQGCNVVVVGSDGPVLWRTPVQKPADYRYHFEADIQLASDGSATIRGQLELTGQASMRSRSSFQSVTRDDKRKSIVKFFKASAPGLELDTFRISNLEDKYAPLLIDFEGHVPHLATKTGKRLFVYPAMPWKSLWYGEHPSRRSEDFYIGAPFMTSQDINISIPSSLTLESRPANVKLDTEFGLLTQTVTEEGQHIRYTGVKSEKKLKVDIEAYKQYYDFRVKAKQAHTAPLVFKQN